MNVKHARRDRQKTAPNPAASRTVNRVLREAYGRHVRDRVTLEAARQMLGRRWWLAF